MPLAVIVKIFVAGHFVRNIAGAANAVLAIVASAAPDIKRILLTDFAYIVGKLVDTGEASALAFLQTI